MTVITGFMKDFGLSTLNGLSPRIHFKADGGGVGVGGIFVDNTKTVVPDASTGAFTVALQSLAEIRPPRLYKVWVEWLDSAANFVARTDIPGGLWVGDTNGTIAENFITGGGAPGLTWISLDPPPEHGPFVSWLKTNPNLVDDYALDSGTYYEWEG